MAEIKHGSITVLLINNYCAIVFMIPDQIIGLFITQSLWRAFEQPRGLDHTPLSRYSAALYADALPV